MPSSESVSVVVPVYQGRDGLQELVTRIIASLRPEEITRLARSNPEVRGIDLSRNFGQHNALLCGIRAARFPVTVTIDDDLQHPPEEIPRVVGFLLDSHSDVVYGTAEEQKHGPFRNISSLLLKRIIRIAMKVDSMDEVSAFRAFRTDLRSAFSEYSSPFVSVDVLLSWATQDFASIAVPHAARARGTSNYTFRSLFMHSIDLITGFSLIPLRVATISGFLFSFFGVLVIVYVLGRYIIEGGSIPGFPFLASTIAIFSGVQLFALGIMGEYLGRMHIRLMGRPAFSIRETTDAGSAGVLRGQQ
jgi:undecaprenyl-phosphate 4-deoxy-4-formamido-L-arabinose transferase